MELALSKDSLKLRIPALHRNISSRRRVPVRWLWLAGLVLGLTGGAVAAYGLAYLDPAPAESPPAP